MVNPQITGCTINDPQVASDQSPEGKKSCGRRPGGAPLMSPEKLDPVFFGLKRMAEEWLSHQNWWQIWKDSEQLDDIFWHQNLRKTLLSPSKDGGKWMARRSKIEKDLVSPSKKCGWWWFHHQKMVKHGAFTMKMYGKNVKLLNSWTKKQRWNNHPKYKKWEASKLGVWFHHQTWLSKGLEKSAGNWLGKSPKLGVSRRFSHQFWKYLDHRPTNRNTRGGFNHVWLSYNEMTPQNEDQGNYSRFVGWSPSTRYPFWECTETLMKISGNTGA